MWPAQRRIVSPRWPDEIEYTEKYCDDLYEYRHVVLCKPVAKEMFKLTGFKRLLKESEWRRLGVQQGDGWAHYEIHRPEPHILLFRRPLAIDRKVAVRINKERALCQCKHECITLPPTETAYSDKYYDDVYEYRHVILPERMVDQMRKLTEGNRLLEDSEWRALGVQQSGGWVHCGCEIHEPGLHTLLFRRPVGTDPKHGLKGSTRKVFMLEVFPKKVNECDITCTGISGDIITFTMPRSNSMMELMATIADSIKFPRELLSLVLPDGTCVDEPNCCMPLENALLEARSQHG
eukprot:TRINITY_DN107008_c0_g1_i1.p1 TRINITY_DN107008_c0_g1~~TRINITY_DN107008_c0_g1_i1.p1  ORF type:complete len:292 (+),score=27.11 TRINITY_DN107008_c0_g1_i1:35-910(+)